MPREASAVDAELFGAGGGWHPAASHRRAEPRAAPLPRRTWHPSGAAVRGAGAQVDALVEGRAPHRRATRRPRGQHAHGPAAVLPLLGGADLARPALLPRCCRRRQSPCPSAGPQGPRGVPRRCPSTPPPSKPRAAPSRAARRASVASRPGTVSRHTDLVVGTARRRPRDDGGRRLDAGAPRIGSSS